jgi:hypothetical protein
MARARGQRRSIRSLASGRYQARFFDPDTRRMVPASQTFTTKGTPGPIACRETLTGPGLQTSGVLCAAT